MNVLIVAVVGAAIPACLGLIVWGLVPARPSLEDRLAALSRPNWAATNAAEEPGGWTARFQRWAAAVVDIGVKDRTRLAQNLAIMDRTRERYGRDKLLVTAAGACSPVLLWLVLAPSRIFLPIPLILVVAVAGAAGGFFLPDMLLRSAAKERRSEAKWVISGLLDLMCIQLAAGAGVATGVQKSAASGTGWLFAHIRDALDRALRRGQSPWDALAEVGDRLGIPELRELTSSIGLAGTTGAAVRESLAAKAITLRDHCHFAALEEAERQDQELVLPLTLQVTAILVLVGYPALARIMAI